MYFKHFIDLQLGHSSLMGIVNPQWWQDKIAKGICHYCGGKFAPISLTMDHIVPIARGGKSAKGHVVPSCKKCNTTKKYYTPAEIILREKMGKHVDF